MSNIFITGISGFAGSNLARHFATQASYSVIGHSRFPEQTRTTLGAKIEVVDDYSADLFNLRKTDVVIHLAGIAHDLSNRYVDDDYYRVNSEQTKKIFDDFVSSDATTFIFLSSIKAVVEDSATPAVENVIPQPGTAYGKSKRLAEEYILSRSLPSSKKAYIFRPCMIHGPGNKGNLNLLYQYVKSGMPYPLGSFENQRSFLNIDNFNFVIQQSVAQDIPSGIYHLADSGSLSTKELYKLIAAALNKHARIWNLSEGMIRTVFTLLGRKRMLAKLTENLLVSNRKIVDAIGKPLPVSIALGITKTIRSFTENSAPA